MADSDPICMCGTKARQAYNNEGVKVPNCARCGHRLPDSRTPMERMLDQPDSRPALSSAQLSAADDWGIVRKIAWVAAIITSGVAIIHWVSAQADQDAILSAI